MSERVLILCDLGAEVMRRLAADERIVIGRQLEDCPDAAVRGQVTTVVTRSGLQIDRGFLDALPRLRYLIRAGSGLDNIDTEELTRRGITLLRNASFSAGSVAELALASWTLLARRIPEAHALLLRGVWAKPRLVGDNLAALSVAVWGAGPVGVACARAFERACGEVSFAAWPSVPHGLRQADPEALVRQADVHVLCLPLRPGTAGLFGGGFFEKVRARRPYLLNLSRFGLLNLDDAVAALARGELRGLFIDPIESTDTEHVRQVLSRYGGLNLLLSQHLGAQRADVMEEIGRWVARQIDEVS